AVGAPDMSKRNSLLTVVSAVALVVVLLLPSLTARAIAAGFILLFVIGLFIKTLRSRPSTEQDQETDADRAAPESAQEIFARGKLFEATMNGMREGLVVVDRDMRVVASNT